MFNAKKIRAERERNNMSSYDLQKLLFSSGVDVSHQTILNWENKISVPRADQVVAIAEIFNKPVTYFFNLKRNRTVAFYSTTK
jgi:transcriptional regulator with XRE-family HTH domain